MYKEVKLKGEVKLFDIDGTELFLTDEQENQYKIQVIDANGKLRLFDTNTKNEIFEDDDIDDEDYEDDEPIVDEDGKVGLKTIMEMDDDVKSFLLQSQYGIDSPSSFWDIPFVKICVVGLVIILVYFFFIR